MVAPPTALALVVVQGPDAGASLRVDAVPRVVGRARDSDLVLTDLGVSRRHLQVSKTATGLRLEVRAGAAPLLIEGRDATVAELSLGESAVLGNTVLRVVEAPEDGDVEREITQARTLLGGLAADVRGLAAVYELTEALDALSDRAGAGAAIAAWAGRHAAAVSAELLSAAQARARPPLLRAAADAPVVVESAPAGDEGPALSVVVDPAEPVTLVLRFAPGAAIGDAQRRLAVVAARVCASSVVRLARLEASEANSAALRRLAVGEARSFLGSSPDAIRIASVVPKLAATDALALLLGESGTGKTFLARLIHEAGPRAREPLRVVNCAAIPEGLLEAELFGHERGAFTGATNARAGAFEAAGRGTILLDEVGELSLASQAKLLRVLEERRFERLGSNAPIPLACRVLAATNRDLRAMVDLTTFRSDLYFRLSVVTVRLPPLSDRGDDVVLLAERILADLAPTAARRLEGFAPEALSAIRRYGWPGNVRELRNAIEHAIVLGEGPLINRADLPETVRGVGPIAREGEGEVVALPANLEWLEARAIEAAMKITGGNRTRAAAILGINRVTLYKKLKS